MLFMKKVGFYKLSAAAFLLAGLITLSRAVDISTYCFANCGFPDTSTGTVSFSATFGEDTDYQATSGMLSYAVYGVGTASVTVDNRTGLMWITNPLTAAGFSISSNTWESALTSCTVTMNNFSGTGYYNYTDWRLPNIRELQSLVNYGVGTPPAVDPVYFGAKPGPYWSSTTYEYGGLTTQAWVIDFTLYGACGPLEKTSLAAVRCVRGGPQ